MKKIRCKVCHTRFVPSKEVVYCAAEKTAPLSALTAASRVFECFDCPQCGCQNAVNVRMTLITGDDGKEGDANGE